MVTNWTDINKASGTSYTAIPKPTNGSASQVFSGGEPIGLLMALTYTTVSSVMTSMWTDISKPSGLTWTDIPKAT
jgi:hypothetical protein